MENNVKNLVTGLLLIFALSVGACDSQISCKKIDVTSQQLAACKEFYVARRLAFSKGADSQKDLEDSFESLLTQEGLDLYVAISHRGLDEEVVGICGLNLLAKTRSGNEYALKKFIMSDGDRWESVPGLLLNYALEDCFVASGLPVHVLIYVPGTNISGVVMLKQLGFRVDPVATEQLRNSSSRFLSEWQILKLTQV